MEEIDKVPIHPDFLEHISKLALCSTIYYGTRSYPFYKKNHDCFAWSHKDITGINLKIVMHCLQVDLDHPLVKLKRRKFTPKQNKIINEKIQKLIDIGSVHKVQYPE